MLNKHAQVIESFPYGVLICDQNGHIVRANHEILNMFGYSADELEGMPVEALIPEQFRAHHPSYVRGFLAKPEIRKMGIGKEVSGLRKNNETFPVEIGLSPLVSDDSTYVVATVIDVTLRKQLQGSFENMIEAAPVGIMIVNHDGLITHANPALSKIFGFKISELTSMSVEDLVPIRHRANHPAWRNSYTENPSSRSMGEGRDLTGQHASGIEIPIEIGLSPIELNGESAVIATVIDITSRKKDETRLQQLNADLDEFTYVASHDLKSPLRGINDLLEWIQEDLGSDIPDEVKNNLDRAHIRIKRMEHLINVLLSFARSGHLDATHSEIDIKSDIEDIISDLSLPPSFTVNVSSEIDTMSAAKTPLDTVLRNLISNAVKHHDNETGQIDITISVDGDFCIFSIKDDGPGIPKNAHERIFKLFQALKPGSSGVGLSIVKRLVEAQRGTVKIFSEPDQRGTEFRVWWPRYTRKDNQ
jgi:PAS domain S-box-containing protein